jgi:hypothetical protein
MQTDTSGGDTDTDVNELAAIPTGSPSTSAQTAVTPDGKQPKARRSWFPVTTGCMSIISLLHSANGGDALLLTLMPSGRPRLFQFRSVEPECVLPQPVLPHLAV